MDVKGKVNKMLNEIKMNYRKARTQKDLFTSEHVLYNCDFKYKNETIKTTYQCNPRHGKPTRDDVLACIISDAEAYEFTKDEADFLIEFGYADSKHIREGLKAYKGCKAISERLHKVFTDKELDTLRGELEEANAF